MRTCVIGRFPARILFAWTLATATIASSLASEPSVPGTADIPPTFEPWWAKAITDPQRESSRPQFVSVDTLIVGALKHSYQVRAIADMPLVDEARIVETEADFDLRAFMESGFGRASDPVGNALTTGGPPRFRESNWHYTAGITKPTTRGGTFELSQQIGYRDNNSIFFIPPVQGNTRLVLSFTQPLLRGSGERYNLSRTVLARIDAGAAWDRFHAELQDHLLDITDAYWQLYFQRAAFLQKQRAHRLAQIILENLEGRRTIDSLRSEVLRARAAVATRGSEMARAARNIQNAEARIRSLVNAPDLMCDRRLELLPVDAPARYHVPADFQIACRTAFEHRPEINEAVKRVHAATTRAGVSKNEILPTLNLVMETYVAGLQGQTDIAQAFADQFAKGEPGYSIGLQFEVPLGRREARAAYRRRQIELDQLTNRLRATAATVLADVEVAVGEVDTSHRTMQGKYHAMVAAEEEVAYLDRRWRVLPGEDYAASFMLSELLDAQERAAFAQFEFAHAQVAYTTAIVDLKRATGTLLQHEAITYRRVCENGVPTPLLEKPSRDPPIGQFEQRE